MKNDNGKTKTILLAAGGTGGHVFPAVSVANELVRRGYKCRFVTDNRGIKYLPDEYKIDTLTFFSKTSPRILLYMLLAINVVRFVFKFLFIRRQISMVIGFGGYPSIPPVLAGQIIGIKTIIHEQNANIGKANSVLCRMANMAIMSFDCVQPRCKNAIHIGNPTRFDSEYQNCTPKQMGDTVKILIIGGSQGAKVFSTTVVEAICKVSETRDIYVYHQVLQEDIDAVKNIYDTLGIKNTIAPFFSNIGDLYQDSDLVISRSGASSIFEIIGFAKPSILLPFLQSINGDQTHNALYLYNMGAADIYYEDRMDKDDMSRMILKIICDHNAIAKMQENLRAISINNVTKMVCDHICSKM